MGVGPAAHEGAGADLDFQISRRARVELVARGQRHVDLGLRPVLGAGAEKGHLAVYIAQPGRCAADPILL